MKVWPLRFRELSSQLLFADDAGGWFVADEAFLDRYVGDQLDDADRRFLLDGGHAFFGEADLRYTSFAWRWSSRQAALRPLSYVIVVPTLRCNLSCGYCQVSRAAESARGYDWTSETLQDVLSFLDRMSVDDVKIEFQGGEPLLRLDLLTAVRDFARKRFSKSEFVVCTNLQRLDDAAWAFLGADDTWISTSLDGDITVHQANRNGDVEGVATFLANLTTAYGRFGPGKICALPTIDPGRPPDFDSLLTVYAAIGQRSIHFRPVVRHGFARRRPQDQDEIETFNCLHGRFIEHLITVNATLPTEAMVEEAHFSHCLKRVLRGGHDGYVDLRNPNFVASDYLVVDFDGRLYPSDEARMLSRIGEVDLAIGSARDGLDRERVATLNAVNLNTFDPDCIHCPYQPFCGADLVDDITNAGRVEPPRHETAFCRRQMAIFDHVFELIYRDDPATQRSLAQWAGVPSWPQRLARRLA